MKILEIKSINKQRDLLKKELLNIIYPKEDYAKYDHIFHKAIKHNNLTQSLPNFYAAVKFTNLPKDDNIPMLRINQRVYSRIDKESYISENVLVFIGLIDQERYSMYDERKSLNNFEKTMSKTMHQEIIKPREIVCIDNRVVFHSRFAFKKIVYNPLILASIIGLVLNFLDFKLPTILSNYFIDLSISALSLSVFY